jgi:hypothetical protein
MRTGRACDEGLDGEFDSQRHDTSP